MYRRLEEITPLVTGRKILHIYITDWKKLRRSLLAVKSYIYTSPTGRNYAVSYWP